MAIKVNSVSYVNKSDIFEGLNLAHNTFCEDFGDDASWGDANFTLILMKPIKEYVKNQTEDLSIDDEEDNVMKEFDILFDRIKDIPDDLYLNFEG
jgi:hypothetical protein